MITTPKDTIEKNDPLNEDAHSPVRSITHKYVNRALFLVTLKCHTYCDFCTRERKVHKHAYKTGFEEGLEYIASHPEINDVIISGGDPLTLPDRKVKQVLDGLVKIPHVEIIRVHTKICSHYPKRITPNLIEILKTVSPLFINLHISTLDELNTPGCREAITMLRDAGFILGSQSVMQRGINDNEVHLGEMFMELLKLGVKPYYIYQMDKTDKYDKYIVDQDRAIEIISNLRKSISGMAVPRLILDTTEYKEILI